MYAHGFAGLPVPVGTCTIAPSVPDTQYKPGACREQHGNQVQLSCFRKHPARDIEQGECSMEYKEKNIENGWPHMVKYKSFCCRSLHPLHKRETNVPVARYTARNEPVQHTAAELISTSSCTVMQFISFLHPSCTLSRAGAKTTPDEATAPIVRRLSALGCITGSKAGIVRRLPGPHP